MCNFLLADEINRTSPKTQSSLLEIMEEFQVTVDGKTYKLPSPFMVLATQNPIESFGTYPLPEAQMDRFFLKLTIGYPDKSEEKMIIDRFGNENPINRLEPVMTTQELIELKERVKEVRVEDCLKEYIINIVDRTRKDNNVVLGCSPRGSLNLYRASKAWAFIKGRDYVLPDDIQKMAVPVLSHRIIMTQGAKMKNIKANKGEDMEALALELSEDSGVEGNKGILEINSLKVNEPKLRILLNGLMNIKLRYGHSGDRLWISCCENRKKDGI